MWRLKFRWRGTFSEPFKPQKYFRFWNVNPLDNNNRFFLEVFQPLREKRAKKMHFERFFTKIWNFRRAWKNIQRIFLIGWTPFPLSHMSQRELPIIRRKKGNQKGNHFAAKKKEVQRKRCLGNDRERTEIWRSNKTTNDEEGTKGQRKQRNRSLKTDF